MTWQLAHLYAFLSWPPLLAVLFIASCRLNAMPRETLFSVVLEYALWAGIAVALLLAPLVGDWPGPVVMLVSWAMAAVLLCSRRAWAGDVAPDVATDHAPLEEIPSTTHRRTLMNFADLKTRLTIWYASQFLSLKEAWEKYTVKWNVLLIAAGTGWNMLPEDAQNKIVESILTVMKIPTSWAVVVIGLIGLFFRLKLQTPKDEE